MSMRLYSLRSIIFISLALAASAFVFAMPASAEPVDHGVYRLHADVGKAIHDFNVAVIKHDAQREAAFFLVDDPVGITDAIRPGRAPYGLKPEYAESYATDGLSFIDLRRRC
jgi:hypothetical protein